MTVSISTDKSKLNLSLIHEFLSEHSSWANGISIESVKKSIDYSLCFGLYQHKQQIGFARVISDYATFANLVDVFVLPGYRSKGYGKKLLDAVIKHPELQNLRRFTLATRDAHGLYAQFGFTPLNKPETFMEVLNLNIYQNADPL